MGTTKGVFLWRNKEKYVTMIHFVIFYSILLSLLLCQSSCLLYFSKILSVNPSPAELGYVLPLQTV